MGRYCSTAMDGRGLQANAPIAPSGDAIGTSTSLSRRTISALIKRSLGETNRRSRQSLEQPVDVVQVVVDGWGDAHVIRRDRYGDARRLEFFTDRRGVLVRERQ